MKYIGMVIDRQVDPHLYFWTDGKASSDNVISMRQNAKIYEKHYGMNIAKDLICKVC